jgi:hypothetical protein
MAVPLPPWPIESLPGSARASAISCACVFAASDEGDGREHADRLEVLQRIEGHLRIEAGVGRQRAGGAHAQRVAVARRLRHHGEADVAARAGPVVDHHRLAELVVEPRHQHAHHRIGAAAGREGHDHADRLVRKVGAGRLGAGGGCQQRAGRGQRHQKAGEVPCHRCSS